MGHGGKREGAGRPKGARNRNTKAVLERLQANHPDYCPISELARIALQEDTPVDLKIKCNQTIASYIIPKIAPIGIAMFDKRNNLNEDLLSF